MKYKVGDKVRIKTWKEMEEKHGIDNAFGTTFIRYTKERFNLSSDMEEDINRLYPDRIIEIYKIKKVHNHKDTCYYSTILNWHFTDDIIEEEIVFEPIDSRFDILDIR